MTPLLLLLACTGGKPADTDTGETGETGDTAETGDTGETGAAEAPWVVAVSALYCQDEGKQGETWYVTVLADDPQGAETVLVGWFSVSDAAGAELAGYGLDCYDGTCDAYFRAEYDGISCAMGPGLTWEFTVQDEDGNWSEAYAYTTG